jgi:6-phosphogluconolactonase
MAPIIHTSDTPADLADAFAKQLIEWIDKSGSGNFHLALSGGKTPSLLFSLLAEKYKYQVPWEKIHFWWGDERMVPPTDPESNYGVVQQLLFSKIVLAPDQVHRIQGEQEPHREAEKYSREIKSLVSIINDWPIFDLVILGLGDDGHTASIFPDQIALLDSNEYTAVATHPESGQLRITLTGMVLNNAKRVAFIACGASKSKIFNTIISNSQGASRLPASHIHPTGELHWFVDKECGENER